MKSIFLALLMILFLFSFVQAADQKESACIKCHADEGTMKSLFKPAKVSAEEGEG
jgi:hypothetical protein